ncbi:hypothetical protein WBG83_18760 [Paenibacillus sp. y28]
MQHSYPDLADRKRSQPGLFFLFLEIPLPHSNPNQAEFRLEACPMPPNNEDALFHAESPETRATSAFLKKY